MCLARPHSCLIVLIWCFFSFGWLKTGLEPVPSLKTQLGETGIFLSVISSFPVTHMQLYLLFYFLFLAFYLIFLCGLRGARLPVSR